MIFVKNLEKYRVEICAALYRKILTLNPFSTDALYNLAMSITQGAIIEKIDLQYTEWARWMSLPQRDWIDLVSNPEIKVEIINLLFRKVLRIDPNHKEALEELSYGLRLTIPEKLQHVLKQNLEGIMGQAMSSHMLEDFQRTREPASTSVQKQYLPQYRTKAAQSELEEKQEGSKTDKVTKKPLWINTR